MRHAGFVLVGGKSTRMGRDKALLPWHGTMLAQYIAAIVAEAAGSAALIGDAGRYGHFGYPVYSDRLSGCGPIGGVVTALTVSTAEWALVTACDMPGISVGALRFLLQQTVGTDSKCIIPTGPSGPEPLCAVYHRACLPTLEKAAGEGRFRMKNVVNELRACFVEGIDPACFANLNSMGDVAAFTRQ